MQAASGTPAGTPCPIEIDAISTGLDGPAPNSMTPAGFYWFSVDEYAMGGPAPVPPNLMTEGAGGAREASADVLTDLGVPVGGPYPPGAFGPRHVGVVDGDGLPSASGFAYPGLGLIEPNPPVAIPPDVGDNVDGIDVPTGTALSARWYFSLDAAFADPLTGVPLQGSGPANGFAPGDVLISGPGAAAPAVFAPAPVLGLDLLGTASDDLDALAVFENGTGMYEPSQTPYDWLGGGSDMVLFSVRRGSAVIGMPDSIFGVPIEEGDVLTTPLPTFLGGVSPFPGLFMAAENLGLPTSRSTGVAFGADLDALDLNRIPMFDCNSNGLEDATDIAVGIEADVNMNGIPDSCEGSINGYCFCPAALAPCGNADPGAGCANSTGIGALIGSLGSTSVGADNLFLVTTQVPTNKFGLYFMGPNQIAAPFGDGLRCVGGSTRRFLPPVNSGATGTATFGPVVGYTLANFPVTHQIASGATWNFQLWYRDPMGPCGTGFNLSNGLSATFVP